MQVLDSPHKEAFEKVKKSFDSLRAFYEENSRILSDISPDADKDFSDCAIKYIDILTRIINEDQIDSNFLYDLNKCNNSFKQMQLQMLVWIFDCAEKEFKRLNDIAGLKNIKDVYKDKDFFYQLNRMLEGFRSEETASRQFKYCEKLLNKQEHKIVSEFLADGNRIEQDLETESKRDRKTAKERIDSKKLVLISIFIALAGLLATVIIGI